MPIVNLRTLVDAIGGPVPAGAVLTATASAPRTSGDVVVGNRQITVTFVDGEPAEPVVLEPSGVDWYWHVRVIFRDAPRVDRFVVVPDVAEVEWADLVDVDPATMQPDPGAVPAWTAAVGQVAAILADTVVARDAAGGFASDAAGSAGEADGFAQAAQAAAGVAVQAKNDSVAARDQAETFAANTVELQDTTFTALIADEDSATRTQLNATMGAYLDDNVPQEVSGALTSDPVVQAGVSAAITGADIPGKVAIQIAAQAGKIVQGSGMPNGVVTASPGTLYVDTSGVAGATVWYKQSGTGATGWEVHYGDTGWRNVSSYLTNGWTGSVYARRVGQMADFRIEGISAAAATSGVAIAIPAGTGLRLVSGSQPSARSVLHTTTMLLRRVFFGSQMAVTSYQATDLLYGQVVGTVSDPWPSAYPGTPT